MELDNIFIAFMCIILISFCCLKLSGRKRGRGDRFYSDRCYLLYTNKHTKSVNLLVSLVSEYNCCALVIKGRIFKFRDNYIVESGYRDLPDHFLVRVDDLDLNHARGFLIGREWSLSNNCLNVFRGYAKEWKL